MLRSNSKAPQQIEILCKTLQNEKGVSINRLWSDHGRKFENSQLDQFCTEVGIAHELFAPITPQQNGVIVRKNRVIQEIARAMMHNKDVAKNLWGEIVKTPYKPWKGRKPNVKYFRILGSTCFILKDRVNVGKFDARSNE